MSNLIVMNNPYKDSFALDMVMNYCAGTELPYLKCEKWGGMGVDTSNIEAAIASMKEFKESCNKTGGKQLFHFVITLGKKPNSTNAKYLKNKRTYESRVCDSVAPQISNFIYQQGFQNCFFKHVNTDVIHIHFVINSVNLVTRMKIQNVNTLANYILNYARYSLYLGLQNICYRKSEFDLND